MAWTAIFAIILSFFLGTVGALLAAITSVLLNAILPGGKAGKDNDSKIPR
jgi:xanthine/uracil permease